MDKKRRISKIPKEKYLFFYFIDGEIFIFLFYPWRNIYFSILSMEKYNISKISKEKYYFFFSFYRFVQGIVWIKKRRISKISKEKYYNILFYPRRNIIISYSIHGEYGRYPKIHGEILFLYFILFYPRKGPIISYSIQGEILFLSICPGDSMDKIQDIHFIHGRYRIYPRYPRYPRKDI